jgi:hypothetical protein
MEITNKTLGLLLVAAVAISLFGTIISINKLNQFTQLSTTTGFATSDQGNVSVYVNTSTSIRFAVNTVNWGTGIVNTTGGYVNCTMMTDGTANSAGCSGFNTVTQNFVLENDGSTLAGVQLASNASAAQFIGGDSSGGGPLFRYTVTNNETGSCSGPVPSSFTDVNTTAPGTQICPVSGFNYTDTRDSMNISIYVNIPYTAPSGQKSATLTATAG